MDWIYVRLEHQIEIISWPTMKRVNRRLVNKNIEMRKKIKVRIDSVGTKTAVFKFKDTLNKLGEEKNLRPQIKIIHTYGSCRRCVTFNPSIAADIFLSKKMCNYDVILIIINNVNSDNNY